MSGRCFVDTNILVYARHAQADPRHEMAAELVGRLWRDRRGVLSTQVLQELYVTLRKKVTPPFDRTEALRVVEDYLTWRLVVNDGNAVREAIELEKRHRISFWDALIVHAANASGASTLYTEDLSHGQAYGQATARNPFLERE